MRYGFCTAVCPTYVLTRDENEAPRGRIDLIRAMLEKGGRPDPKTVGHIDSCLSCNSCMTACAVDVDYLHLSDIARAFIEANYRRPLGDRLMRGLIARTIPEPACFARMSRLARLVRPFRGLLPHRLRNLVDLAPNSLPPARDLTGTHPAEGKQRRRVALLQGCVQQVLAPDINAATIRLLTRHGVEVVVPPAAGVLRRLHPAYGQGKRWRSCGGGAECRRLAQRDVAGDLRPRRRGRQRLGLRHRRQGLRAAAGRRSGPLQEGRRSVAAIARDVTELLKPEDLKLQRRLPCRSAVAYHDACSLQHAQKVRKQPRALLAQRRLRREATCRKRISAAARPAPTICSSPTWPRRWVHRKAGHIESTGATAIAAGNLGCLAQIARFTPLPLLHTVELLDWATGGPLPAALRDADLPAPLDRAISRDPGATPATSSSPQQGDSAGPGLW